MNVLLDLHPVDLARASGSFYLGPPPLPSVLGSDGVGRLQPTAMVRTIGLIDSQVKLLGLDVTLPCSDDGSRR